MSRKIPNPAKMAIRDKMASCIAELTAEEKNRQSQIIFEKLINHPWYKNSERISLYMSTDQEVNTNPIIHHVFARGAAAFVPQYAGGQMRMLRLHSDDRSKMKTTKHGIVQHSKEHIRADALETGGLDLILAPGVAFTRSGNRVGHGAGYYDKYIANLRSNANCSTKIIALAFTCQILDEVPVDEHDQTIDEVITAD